MISPSVGYWVRAPHCTWSSQLICPPSLCFWLCDMRVRGETLNTAVTHTQLSFTVCLNQPCFISYPFCFVAFDDEHCWEPYMPHGNFSSSDITYQLGTTVTFTCSPGFVMGQGSGTIECVDPSNPHWNDTEPVCRGNFWIQPTLLPATLCQNVKKELTLCQRSPNFLVGIKTSMPQPLLSYIPLCSSRRNSSTVVPVKLASNGLTGFVWSQSTFHQCLLGGSWEQMPRGTLTMIQVAIQA